MTTVHGDAPAGLLEAFWAYERALMADDTAAMDALFAPGPGTVRGDRDGLLVGHDAIGAFRRARGGAPPRELVEVRVSALGDGHALVVAVTAPRSGGRGLQTQVWRLGDGRWQVVAAHVAGPPATFDLTVWRAVGDPLVPGASGGPLAGETLAVKDLYAVAGHRVGAGVPAWLDGSPVHEASAPAVQRLLDAGASVRGLARTDQLAYSIAGTNEHVGAPVNAAVPGAVPGGSSSGSATAVALGAASIGLGTDTAGSIRVPASYQGLWGLRTTHGSVDVDGLLALAPDFDTVGLLTRDAALLRRAAAVLVPDATATASGLVVAPVLTAVAEPPVAAALAEHLGGDVETVDVGDVDAAFEAFRVHQAFQAWQVHGAWLTAHPDALLGAARERFAVASRVTADEDASAVAALREVRTRLDDVLGDRVIALPSASSTAPLLTVSSADVDRVRGATLRLTCLAGITGRPAVSVPALTVGGAPVGLCLVGPRGSDLALVDLADDVVAENRGDGEGTPG